MVVQIIFCECTSVLSESLSRFVTLSTIPIVLLKLVEKVRFKLSQNHELSFRKSTLLHRHSDLNQLTVNEDDPITLAVEMKL